MENAPDRRFAFSSTTGGPGGWQLCPDDPLCTFQIRGPSPTDPFLQNCTNYREKQEKKWINHIKHRVAEVLLQNVTLSISDKQSLKDHLKWCTVLVFKKLKRWNDSHTCIPLTALHKLTSSKRLLTICLIIMGLGYIK